MGRARMTVHEVPGEDQCGPVSENGLTKVQKMSRKATERC